MQLAGIAHLVSAVELSANLHLVPRSGMAEVYLHSPIRLHYVLLNLFSVRTTLTFNSRTIKKFMLSDSPSVMIITQVKFTSSSFFFFSFHKCLFKVHMKIYFKNSMLLCDFDVYIFVLKSDVTLRLLSSGI
jgi:hypothetical protein